MNSDEEITWKFPKSFEECTSAFIENLKTGELYHYSISDDPDDEKITVSLNGEAYRLTKKEFTRLVKKIGEKLID